MTLDRSLHTIFIVDDEPAVLKSLARLLGADGWRTRTFPSAESLLAARDLNSGACLVLDVNLPGLDGLELQSLLGETGLGIPIVFLTGVGDIPMSVRAMKAGAADFFTKPVQGRLLDAAIVAAIERAAGARERGAEATVLRERLASLSAREREVLAALADGKLNKQIAAELGIVEQTVKFHRTRIMQRLRAKTVAQLMKIVAVADSNDAR